MANAVTEVEATDEDPEIERRTWFTCKGCGAKYKIVITRTGRPTRIPTPRTAVELPGSNCGSLSAKIHPADTKHTNPCILKAADDEPLFVLRAQDGLAPATVAYWINMAEAVGVLPSKLDAARKNLRLMVAYGGNKKIPD